MKIEIVFLMSSCLGKGREKDLSSLKKKGFYWTDN